MKINYSAKIHWVLYLCLFLSISQQMVGQSDSCAGAPSLTVAASCTTTAYNVSQTFTNSTTEAPFPCAGTSQRDGWYTFTTDATTTAISIEGTSNRQMGLAVYSGACGSGTLIQVACTVPVAANAALINVAVSPSTTYKLRIMRTNNLNVNDMTGTICVYKYVAITNDDCAGAVSLTPNASTTCSSATAGTTVGATQTIAALTCAGFTGNADDDVWYKFVATGSTHTVTVTGAAGFDPVVDLRSGACNGSTLNCSDATVGGGTETFTTSGLTAGTTYYVRVYSYGLGSYGNFTICVTTPAAGPANDNCSGAVNVAVNPSSTCTSSTSGTTVSATQSQAGCAGTADDDVWYKFTATSATHTITVTRNTIYDIVFQVFSGTCAGTLTSLGCIDDTTGNAAEAVTLSGLTVGSTYFIRVYSYFGVSTDSGTFTICITTPTVPANNNCAAAVGVAVNPNLTCSATTSGTTVAATQSQTACAGTADDDVWYSFTATGTSHNITVTPGTLYDAVFQIFSGSCGTLTSMGCIDNTVGSANETKTLTGLTVGATYFIRVYSYSASVADQGTFTICITTPVPVTNNDCAAAIGLTVNPTASCTSSTAGTSTGATQSLVGCVGNADDDVWYSFVATSTKHNITVTPGTLSDAVFQIFSGTCGSLTSIDCVDDTLGTSVESATASGLTIGATYFVRVYSYSGAANAGTFSVCVTTVISCTAGSSTGSTDLGCPSVVAGGLGLNGADPAPVSCTAAGCVDLEATYLQLGQPTSYTVQSIPYAPPYQFGCLANPVSVNNDDVWSPVINLPFNFCFYGNTYNQCLMSSNGVITFDQTANIPGGYSTWSFANNIPNATLFHNSIFGVYHDIDPRTGGEVGWELITLNTGCRALVASWSNIPMFSTECSSQLYTGMIVLYENTNIIDVYTQTKSVCATWNGGNAIIGIQDAAGTTGLAAPGRNGLDPDWTVTNEAWRFVPSGTSITSIKWYQGAGTSGPVVGTTNTINVCPAATTTYTAQVTYTLCNGTTLKEIESTTVTINSSKQWNGSVSNNWNTPANWTPSGVPTALDCIVIPDVTGPAADPIISGSAYDALGYSIRVLNGGNLTINSANNLTITDFVNVSAGGNFLIKDDASLIQVNNTANTGIVNMERTTTPVYRFDYTYWNSPMTLASNYTLGMLSQNLTQPDKYYHWIPSIGNGIGGWAQESAATIMDPTRGYIIRSPNTYSFTPTVFAPYTGTFTGTPNNGPVTCPISFGTLPLPNVNDQWNLIGNPYPSAVNATSFVNYPANTSVIEGTLYFWTHNNAISASFPDPFYGDFVLNYTSSDYAIWNTSGGVAACVTCPAPAGYIAAGQAFFVQSKSVAGNATFTNSMRVTNNNAQFYRPSAMMAAPTFGDETPIERHRVWLDMTNSNSAFNQLLVGYIEGATLNWDRNFDGSQMNDGGVSFYSLIPEHYLAIQGRPLPFDIQDTVPLGYRSTNADNYSIRINHFDGLFDNQNIYLEDKLLDVIHNLKQSPYYFSTDAGTFNERFVLRYTDNTLGIDNSGAINSLTAFISAGQLHVRAAKNIENVSVYDVAGKLIRSYAINENSNDFAGDFNYAQGVYLAKIKLVDGTSASRKLMN